MQAFTIARSCYGY